MAPGAVSVFIIDIHAGPFVDVRDAPSVIPKPARPTRS